MIRWSGSWRLAKLGNCGQSHSSWQNSSPASTCLMSAAAQVTSRWRPRWQVGPAGEVVGIDASPEMIDVAARKAARSRRRQSNVKFNVESVEALSFQDASFDVVLSSLMMHHLPGDLKARALAEIRRVLRPGGRLVVVDMQPSGTAKGGKLSGGPLLWVHRRSGRQEAPMHAPSSAGQGLSYLAAPRRRPGSPQSKSGPTSHAWIGYLRARTPS